MADDDTIFEIENILGRRIRKGKIEYLINWKGYSSDSNSWEPIQSLGEALDIIEEYNQNIVFQDFQSSNSTKSHKLSESHHTQNFEGKKGQNIPDTDMASKVKVDQNSNIARKKILAKHINNNAKRNGSNNAGVNKVNGSNNLIKNSNNRNSKKICTVKQEKKNGTGRGMSSKNQDGVGSDSDDENLLYSLNTDEEPVGKQRRHSTGSMLSSESRTSSVKDPNKKPYMTMSERRKKMAEPRTLRSGKTVCTKPVKLEFKPKHRMLSESSTEIAVDAEISFRSIDSPKRIKMMEFSPKTNTVIRPVPRMAQSPILSTSGIQSPLTQSTPYKISSSSPFVSANPRPCSPRLARSRSVTPSELFTNIGPLFSAIPASPSTVSYKNLISDSPRKLLANHCAKRKQEEDSDDEEDVVERRLSVRQSELSFKYKEIVVKKFKGYTQMWLFTTTQMRNALNPSVFQELISALNNAKFDDSKLVMLSGSGNTFCSGIDLNFFSNGDTCRRVQVKKMVDTLREFINTIISFPKPIVVAVNGPAIGLGVGILPLCDIVYASDKASFYMPYSRLGQTPEGCASFALGQVVGQAMANEMLLGGRKLTAIEAYQCGLVSQVFWPTSMMQEVIPRVRNMASFSAKAMETTKLLIHGHQKAKLEFTNENECNMLIDRWSAVDCHKSIQSYLEDENDVLF